MKAKWYILSKTLTGVAIEKKNMTYVWCGTHAAFVILDSYLKK